MQYFSEKVIEIQNKLYSSMELIKPAHPGDEPTIVLKQVEKVEKKHYHPVRGAFSTQQFEKIPRMPKFHLRESQWTSLPDRNTENLKVDLC